MLVRSLSTWAIQSLKESTSPHLDAELLLGHVLGLTRAQIIARYDDDIELFTENHFKQLVKRRQSGEPIAYLLGYREFWSLNFEVTPATLIPRPETELLVELALQRFSADQKIQVLDLGTGSGAIAIAIAHERPHWSVIATDRSEDALIVAARNAKRLGVHNVSFRKGNWFEALLSTESFHLIISNPPYIADNDPHLQQQELRFEPRSALVAGKNGMHDLYLIVQQAHRHLLSSGRLLLEHGFDQKKVLMEILHQDHYIEIESYADFSGITRVCAASV